jgi:hypothetical protein
MPTYSSTFVDVDVERRRNGDGTTSSAVAVAVSLKVCRLRAPRTGHRSLEERCQIRGPALAIGSGPELLITR